MESRMPVHFSRFYAVAALAMVFALGCGDPVAPSGPGDGQTDGQTDGKTDSGTDGQTDGNTDVEPEWCAQDFIGPVNGVTAASGQVGGKSRLAGSCGGEA